MSGPANGPAIRVAANLSPQPQRLTGGSLVHPTTNDIILGRGVLTAGHPGNVRFYAVIDQYMPMYIAAETRGDKTKVVQLIYDTLTSVGRFVKDDVESAACIILDARAAKKKISHAIRFRRERGNAPARQALAPRARARARDRASGNQQQPRLESPVQQMQQENPVQDLDVNPGNSVHRTSPKGLFSDEELASVLLPAEVMAAASMRFEDFV